MPLVEDPNLSVTHIEPKKVHNTPSSPLPSNVSFAKPDKIDFTPSEKKLHFSPVKVTRVDPRNYEEGGPRSRSGKKHYEEYMHLKPSNKNAYENIAAFAVPEFNANRSTVVRPVL